MLQASVPHVLSVFFRRTLQVCLFGCCICFTHMLQVFYLDVAYVFVMAFQVFSVFFKCFIYLQTYVTNVAFGCFKSRSGVAHVAMTPVAGGQLPAAGLRLLPRAARLALSFSSPPFPSLHLAAVVRAWRETLSDEHANGGGAPSGPTAARCSRSRLGAS